MACPECGLIHPPSPKGECPVAKAQKQEEQLKADFEAEVGKGILDIRGDLMKKFEGQDAKVCLAFTKKVRNFIMNEPI